MSSVMGFVRPPKCPLCGTLAMSKKGAYGVYHQHCGLASWNGKELTTIETLDARRKAHSSFDPLWELGLMTRSEAYSALAGKLGLSRDTCHMSTMDLATALRVPDAVVQIADEWNKKL